MSADFVFIDEAPLPREMQERVSAWFAGIRSGRVQKERSARAWRALDAAIWGARAGVARPVERLLGPLSKNYWFFGRREGTCFPDRHQVAWAGRAVGEQTRVSDFLVDSPRSVRAEIEGFLACMDECEFSRRFFGALSAALTGQEGL